MVWSKCITAFRTILDDAVKHRATILRASDRCNQGSLAKGYPVRHPQVDVAEARKRPERARFSLSSAATIPLRRRGHRRFHPAREACRIRAGGVVRWKKSN